MKSNINLLIKTKLVVAGLLMLGACTTVSPTKSVLIGCNQAYGTLGMLKAMSRAGKVTVTQDQRNLIDQTFVNIVNPICFADEIQETPENTEILKGVIEALESYQIGGKA